MNVHKRNLSATSSTSRSVPARLSTCPWKSAVSKLILPSRLTSLLRPLSGKSSMHICLPMKRCNVLKLRSKWKIGKTRSLFNRLSLLLKILFTPHLWSVLSKLWREWLFRMLMKRSSTITDIILNRLMTPLQAPLTALSFPSGVSQLNAAERSTLPLSAGILSMTTYSQSVMVLMISWSKTPVWSAASPSRTLLTQSTSSLLSLVWCALTSTPSSPPSSLSAATTVPSWSLILESRAIISPSTSQLWELPSTPTPCGKSAGPPMMPTKTLASTLSHLMAELPPGTSWKTSLSPRR